MKRTVHDKWKVAAALLLSIVLTACVTSPSTAQSKDRLAKAQAMFAQRCQSAGEKIHRTVSNVDGIMLLKIRPHDTNYDDQFLMSDPYGKDLSGDGYIKSFLRGNYWINFGGGGAERVRGFRYVDAIDSRDGLRYRYVGHIDEPWENDKSYLKGYLRFSMTRSPVEGEGARYGVTYDDISTQEDREYWIAGSSLKIIDMKTNEVIAERIGYMMDFQQGGRENNRSPWLFAADHACPSFSEKNPVNSRVPSFTLQLRQADRFVEKVLQPKLDEVK